MKDNLELFDVISEQDYLLASDLIISVNTFHIVDNISEVFILF